MSTSRFEKLLFVAGAATFASLLPWFTSCAVEDTADTSAKEDAMVIPTDSAANDASTAPDTAKPAPTCKGVAWCPVTTPVSTLYALTAVWGSSKSDVWAVGSGGTIIHYDGTTWTATPTPVRNTFHAVWGSGPNDVWAVSMTDVLFHTDGFAAGKAVWTKAPAAKAEENDQFPRAVLAVWGTSKDHVRIGARDRTVSDPATGEFPIINQYTKVVAVTDGGVVDSGSGDSGAKDAGSAEAGAGPAWARTEGIGAVHGFWGSSADDIWYVADNGEKNGWQKGVTMHGTLDAKTNGLSWVAVDSQSTVVLEGIWGSSKDDLWTVGDMGTIRHLTAGALRWAVVPSPTTEALHAIWGSAANDIWAVGDDSTILHFDGTAWKPSSAMLDKPHDLYGVWGSSANDVWIVGDGVTLHYTGSK